MTLPPIPSWDALHPLVIHFPIVLLLIAPVFIIAGAILAPAGGRPFLVAAMALLLAGTASVFVAVETGERAGQLAERAPGVGEVLQAHEALAERTRVVFTALSVIFVMLLFAPPVLKKPATRLATTTLPLAFLVLYAAGAVLLVNTAHNGGRLVHEFGVRAMVNSSPADSGAGPPMEAEQEKD